MVWPKGTDAKELIKSEIYKGIFNFADTNQFLTHFFPVRESDIDAIYDALPTNVYNKSKTKWSDLAETREDILPEHSVHKSFARTTNAILAASVKIRRTKAREKQATHNVFWFDRPKQGPSVLGDKDHAALIRPKLALMLATNEKLLKWEEVFKRAEEEISAVEAVSFLVLCLSTCANPCTYRRC